MPYIPEESRDALQMRNRDALNPGELNFQFTQLVVAYLDSHGLSYKTINDIMGALEGAKSEFYRRVAVPYENTKIAENGDVYD